PPPLVRNNTLFRCKADSEHYTNGRAVQRVLLTQTAVSDRRSRVVLFGVSPWWPSGGEQAVGAGGGEAGEDTAVGDHSAAVVVPVGVFARARAVVGDEGFDGGVAGVGGDVGEVDVAFQDGVGAEVVGGDVQRGPGGAAQVVVLGAVGGEGDQDAAVVHHVQDV